MTRHFKVVLERDSQGFFVATVPLCLAATPRRNHWTS